MIQTAQKIIQFIVSKNFILYFLAFILPFGFVFLSAYLIYQIKNRPNIYPAENQIVNP